LACLFKKPRHTLAIVLCLTSATFSTAALGELFAAVLPSSRSVEIDSYASFYATVINAGAEDLSNCRAEVANNVPGTLWYRPMQPGIIYPTAERGTPADIPAGASQLLFLEFRSSTVLLPVEIAFDFVCDGAEPAAVVSGVNTLLFSASTQRTPDIVALTATLTGDGIVNLPTDGSGAFFAAATSNLGATGNLTVRAVGSGDAAFADLTVCATNAVTGRCTSLSAPSTTLRIGSGERNTFTAFMRSTRNIPFDPARNRVSLQFADAAGEIRGSTSIAVRSADLTISGVPASSLLTGESYLFTPTVGKRGNRTVSFTLDNQPAWLAVSANGVLTGSPGDEDVGVYDGLVLRVSDGENVVELPPFSIEVLASQWRSGPVLPYEVSRHTMATLNGQLFYFGTQPQGFSTQQDGVREYNASINSWTARTPMPIGVAAGNAHGIGGQVYVFGSADNIVQRYDPQLDSWSQLGASPPRYGAASAEVDGLVYLIGGVQRNVTGSNLSSQLDIYNPSNNSWIIGPPAPIRCDGSGAAAIGDVIYLTGGCANSAQVHAFDTNTGTWSQTTSMPVPLAYHHSVAANGKLYVFGGYSTDSLGVRAARAQAYVFDPASSEWQEIQPMRSARAEFGAALFAGEIWITGGEDDNNRRQDTTEIFSPEL